MQKKHNENLKEAQEALALAGKLNQSLKSYNDLLCALLPQSVLSVAMGNCHQFGM